MDSPSELSLVEIRKFMLNNGCKVTNHALVKHFKEFLTNQDTQSEARKQFKTYVNILATVKTEERSERTASGKTKNEKYLVLKSKYLNECPAEDTISNTSFPVSSPSTRSLNSEFECSPYRQPPPYRPPPEVTPPPAPPKIAMLEPQTRTQFKDCINEFKSAVSALNRQTSAEESSSSTVELRHDDVEEPPPLVPPRKRSSADRSISSRCSSIDKPDNEDSISQTDESNKENLVGDKIMEEMIELAKSESESKMSVKEAMKKFNQYASEEEKVISPVSKKKPEKGAENNDITTNETENLISHPKAKEWLVSAARANYQELSKLATEYPMLVKLQDPTTTALHWAAKHGNENIVKLIAGTYKADVNSRTNGGYTPLHIAMQFERDNIFELLQNVYKANRDLFDWSGKKPLDYRKQKTSVSASTYSKIKARKKHSEKDSGFLRIGSLNVRVKKTTEAFSNFLGVGSSNHHHSSTTRAPLNVRSSVPTIQSGTTAYFDKIHKNWGSADNIPHNPATMPPPKYGTSKKRRSKRNADFGSGSGGGSGGGGVGGNLYNTTSHSMPTTPSQPRAPIGILSEHPDAESAGDSDSDSAFGFDSNWNGGKPGGIQRPTYI